MTQNISPLKWIIKDDLVIGLLYFKMIDLKQDADICNISIIVSNVSISNISIINMPKSKENGNLTVEEVLGVQDAMGLFEPEFYNSLSEEEQSIILQICGVVPASPNALMVAYGKVLKQHARFMADITTR
jgi:hypothetical protein